MFPGHCQNLDGDLGTRLGVILVSNPDTPPKRKGGLQLGSSKEIWTDCKIEVLLHIAIYDPVINIIHKFIAGLQRIIRIINYNIN